MKITPNQDSIEKAKLLTEVDAELMLSRMSKKLKRILIKEKLGLLEVLAIQIEREEEQLTEWREAFLKFSGKNKT
jgi:hypothetical protein